MNPVQGIPNNSYTDGRKRGRKSGYKSGKMREILGRSSLSWWQLDSEHIELREIVIL